MNVDEYKKLFGGVIREVSPYGLFTVMHLAPVPAIPIKLHQLIDEMVKRLNEIYVPGAWMWMRLENRDTWKKLLEIEESISVAIQGESEGYLRSLLDAYSEMWVVIIEAFKPIKDEYIPF